MCLDEETRQKTEEYIRNLPVHSGRNKFKQKLLNIVRKLRLPEDRLETRPRLNVARRLKLHALRMRKHTELKVRDDTAVPTSRLSPFFDPDLLEAG